MSGLRRLVSGNRSRSARDNGHRAGARGRRHRRAQHPDRQSGGVLLATVCYLAVGPLFATPRTATVSFEIGIAPLTGDGALPLLVYSPVYFALVIGVSLYPGKLLDTVGHILAPLKIFALVVLGIAALLWPAGSRSPRPTPIRMRRSPAASLTAISLWIRWARWSSASLSSTPRVPRRGRGESVDALHHSGGSDRWRRPDAGLPEPV